jgi:OmpA-OmpF porin, OOP family
MKRILLFKALIINSYALAQQPNLIPNPSFELSDKYPLGWYYKGADFDRVVQRWRSPTGASPDWYSPKVRVPAEWRLEGFGVQNARTGQCMAGITVYGCANGKPHCREYLQVELTEPLVVGQEYELKFWVISLQRGLRVNNLGAYFSEYPINEPTKTDEPLKIRPHWIQTQIVDNQGEWIEMTTKIKAVNTGRYLLLGNFAADEATQKRLPTQVQGLNFGYYYIDDVSLQKVEPLVPLVHWTAAPLEKNKVIILKNIYFDTDKSDLLPPSNQELQELLKFMETYPKLRIEVRGHTDNHGGHDYNIQLSIRRAQQVIAFLVSHGIQKERLHAAGYGSTVPISDNDTETGRQLNRRVEFQILEF